MSNNNDFSQMAKNTVSSKNQMRLGETIFGENVDGNGKRVLFVGNSITLHDIRPSIGWHLECGMAASAPENDYVHIIKRRVREKDTDAAFCVCQASGWERSYKAENHNKPYNAARDFDADVIIMRIIENCSLSEYVPELFEKAYKEFAEFLNKSGKAKIIFTTGFWKHPGDELIAKVASELASPCVYLGDLGQDDKMKALGLFEHEGVAVHPGDLGMQNIADRIWEELERLI